MVRALINSRLYANRLERPFAHLYETGGMRRVYVRGHANIRKRLLIHASGFNLGLLMRQSIGVGTPRGLQGGHMSIAHRRSRTGAREEFLSPRAARPIPPPCGNLWQMVAHQRLLLNHLRRHSWRV